MKGKRSKTVQFFKRTYNVRFWLDYERLRTFALYFLQSAKKIFIPQKKSVTSNSFDEVVSKLGLSKLQIQKNQDAFYHFSLILSSVAFCILIYTLYQLFFGSIQATLVSFLLMLLAWTLAFRYHFWYFQIKERRLDCTVKEWFLRGLMGDQ